MTRFLYVYSMQGNFLCLDRARLAVSSAFSLSAKLTVSWLKLYGLYTVQITFTGVFLSESNHLEKKVQFDAIFLLEIEIV